MSQPCHNSPRLHRCKTLPTQLAGPRPPVSAAPTTRCVATSSSRNKPLPQRFRINESQAGLGRRQHGRLRNVGLGRGGPAKELTNPVRPRCRSQKFVAARFIGHCRGGNIAGRLRKAGFGHNSLWLMKNYVENAAVLWGGFAAALRQCIISIPVTNHNGQCDRRAGATRISNT